MHEPVPLVKAVPLHDHVPLNLLQSLTVQVEGQGKGRRREHAPQVDLGHYVDGRAGDPDHCHGVGEHPPYEPSDVPNGLNSCSVDRGAPRSQGAPVVRYSVHNLGQVVLVSVELDLPAHVKHKVMLRRLRARNGHQVRQKLWKIFSKAFHAIHHGAVRPELLAPLNFLEPNV